MPTVRAYAAQSAAAQIAPWQIERRDPGQRDVVIDITYSGICHSDIHQVNEDWGAATFPMVPGHEIVGRVAAIGSDAGDFAVGDRVGVGVFIDSCRECEACLTGHQNYCLAGQTVPTYNGKELATKTPTYGGYSTSIVVDRDYVLRVPTNLDEAAAAPLLCAGITLWSPLRHWEVGPESRVAIVGLGGLGHMGVKFAHALSAEVTVLSHSASKETEALALGADHFVDTSKPGWDKKVRSSFNLILNTVSAEIDVNRYLSTLRWDGTLVLLGITGKPIQLEAWNLMGQRKSLSASQIGGIQETQEMLNFCGEHNITSEVEVVAATYINQAYQRVIDSDVRYRFVIDAKTF